MRRGRDEGRWFVGAIVLGLPPLGLGVPPQVLGVPPLGLGVPSPAFVKLRHPLPLRRRGNFVGVCGFADERDRFR